MPQTLPFLSRAHGVIPITRRPPPRLESPREHRSGWPSGMGTLTSCSGTVPSSYPSRPTWSKQGHQPPVQPPVLSSGLGERGHTYDAGLEQEHWAAGLGAQETCRLRRGEGEKKKGICPIAPKSKLIHKTTSGGNDLRSRGHQTLHVLSVEDTVSQAKGSPATAGRWPGTQPASENRKVTRACFCFSLCT